MTGVRKMLQAQEMRERERERKEILVTCKLNVEWRRRKRRKKKKKKTEKEEERRAEGEMYPAYQSHVSDLAWPGLQFHGCVCVRERRKLIKITAHSLIVTPGNDYLLCVEECK